MACVTYGVKIVQSNTINMRLGVAFDTQLPVLSKGDLSIHFLYRINIPVLYPISLFYNP